MKPLFNEQGYTALLAIFTTVLISILGLTLFTMMTNSLKFSKNDQVNQATYYIAEAGLTVSTTRIEEIIERNYNAASIKYRDPSNRDNKGQFRKSFYNFYINEFTSNPLISSLNSDTINFEKTTSDDIPRFEVIVNSDFAENDSNIHTVEVKSKGIIGGHSRIIAQTINVKDFALVQTNSPAEQEVAKNNYNRDFNIIKNGITINGNSGGGKIYDFRESIYRMPSPPSVLEINGDVTGNGNIQLIFPGTIIINGNVTLNGGSSCLAASEGIIITKNFNKGKIEKDKKFLAAPRISIGFPSSSPNYIEHTLGNSCGKSYNFSPPNYSSPLEFKSPYEL